MKIADELNGIFQRVNSSYWYGESDHLLILLGLVKNKKLKLSRPTIGLLLNEDDSIYLSNDFSFTLGLDFIIGTNGEELTSKLDLLAIELGKIIAWNEAQLSDNKPDAIIKKHKLLLPMNVHKQHWVTLELSVQFEQQRENFFLSNYVTANVYDSSPMYGISNIEGLHKMLNPCLQKFKHPDGEFAYHGAKVATKRQSTNNDCGPITCKTIFDLVTGVAIADAKESYDDVTTRVLRSEHIFAVNDERFTAKQQNFVEAKLSSRQINGDALRQAECLDQYIRQNMADKLTDIFAMLKKFISADDAMQRVNQTFVQLTVAAFEELDNYYKQQLTKVKQWFQTHYEPLLQLNLLQNIFKTPKDRLPETELEWACSGKDTLVEVLKTLLKLPEHYAQQQRMAEQMQLAAKEEAERMALETAENATLIQVTMHINLRTDRYPKNLYSFTGTVTRSGVPHSKSGAASSAKCIEQIYKIYSYEGAFSKGKKVGYGQEQYTHDDLNIITSFVGMRGDDGEPLDGRIVCVLGDQMNNGYHLIYKGSILAGKLHGAGIVCMVKRLDILTPIEVYFSAGTLIRTGKVSATNLTSDDALIGAEIRLVHFIERMRALSSIEKIKRYADKPVQEMLAIEAMTKEVMLYMDTVYVADFPDLPQKELTKLFLLYAARLNKDVEAVDPEDLTDDFAYYLQGHFPSDISIEHSLSEQLQDTLKMIKLHLSSSNTGNIIVIYPEQADDIARVRERALEEYLQSGAPRRTSAVDRISQFRNCFRF